MKVFLSYSWEFPALVEMVDSRLRTIGIRVIRDVRSNKPWDSLTSFMVNGIANADFVVALVSDDYLRSRNCLAEFLLALNKDPRTLLPIVDGSYSELFSSGEWRDISMYWQSEASRSNRDGGRSPSDNTIPDEHQIMNSLPQIRQYIEDTILPSIQELHQSGYRDLLGSLGFDSRQIVADLLEIENEPDIEQREVRLDEFILQYPDHALAHHLRAGVLKQRCDFTRARASYERSIRLDPNFPDANNDYALLLENQFEDTALAEEHYEKAIELDKEFDLALNNYAQLLTSGGRYSDAEAMLRQALDFSPTYTGARMNLATLLAEHLGRPDEARAELELVLQLDDMYAQAHINYSVLLEDYFGENGLAREHKRKADQLRAVNQDQDRGWPPR